MFVCHRCDNPPCCNPAHLFLGTHVDNMRDMAVKGRAVRGDNHPGRARPETRPRGEGNHASKLTTCDVLAIRARWANGAFNKTHVAAEYGVSDAQIGKIVNRKVWKHV